MIDNAEELPHLVKALPEPLLDALHRALVEQVGSDTAGAVLAAFDEEIADLPRRAAAQAEIEREVEAIKRAKDAALAELAGTTGVAYRAWRRGHYVVALDGKHIGDVNPQTTTGHNPPRYSNFVGRAHGTFATTAVRKSAGDAAHQVALDYAQAHGLTLDDE